MKWIVIIGALAATIFLVLHFRKTAAISNAIKAAPIKPTPLQSNIKVAPPPSQETFLEKTLAPLTVQAVGSGSGAVSTSTVSRGLLQRIS